MSPQIADLTLFLNVLDAGTITGGARLSHLSLAAASERIHRLEASLNTPLFVRHRQGVTLTAAGRGLQQHARRVLEEMAMLDVEMRRHGAQHRPVLRVVGNTGACSTLLPEAIERFLTHHPDIDINLEEASSRDIVNAVVEARLEWGVIADTVDSGPLMLKTMRPDPLIAIISDGFDDQWSPTVKFAELLDYPFIGLSRTNALQTYLLGQASRLGRHIEYRLRVPDLHGVIDGVAGGHGVAIVPKAFFDAQIADMETLRGIALSDAWAQRQLALCARDFSALPAGAKIFIDMLQSLAD